MTVTPDQIIPSSFLDNLGADVIAVNAQGTVIGRATTREALERSCPGATYFTGTDLVDAAARMHVEAALGSTEATLAAVVAPGVPENQPVSDNTTNPVVIEPAAADVSPTPADPAAEEPKPVVPDPLDHDGDGVRGGSLPGIQSTAHKGVHNRQRKPSGGK